MLNKKAIAILGAIFLLIVGTLGFLIYSKYSSNKPAQVAQTPVPNPLPTTPKAATSTPNKEVLVKLTSDSVISPALFYSGTGLTYMDRQGNLFQASLQDNNGTLALADKKQVNIPAKPGITKVLWPAKGQDFIAQYSDAAGKLLYSYFNSKTGLYTDLPAQVQSLDWMPNGSQIVYVWTDNGKSNLSLGSPDTKVYQKLTDLWANDNIMKVSPDGTQILFYEGDNALAQSNAINSVTADGKVFKGLVKNGLNFGVLWSPDGQKFLFGKKDAATQRFQLWYYNLTSGQVQPLNLFTTVDKVVWDKDSAVIYAAVPSVGNAGGNSLTVDGFVRVDTSSGDKKTYSLPDNSNIDGRDLFLNSFGDKLFFRNAQDGGLYYLDLTQQ